MSRKKLNTETILQYQDNTYVYILQYQYNTYVYILQYQDNTYVYILQYQDNTYVYIPIHVFHIKRESEVLEYFGDVGGKHLDDKLLPTLKEKAFLPSQSNHIMRHPF